MRKTSYIALVLALTLTACQGWVPQTDAQVTVTESCWLVSEAPAGYSVVGPDMVVTEEVNEADEKVICVRAK